MQAKATDRPLTGRVWLTAHLRVLVFIAQGHFPVGVRALRLVAHFWVGGFGYCSIPFLGRGERDRESDRKGTTTRRRIYKAGRFDVDLQLLLDSSPPPRTYTHARALQLRTITSLFVIHLSQ
jgi:hypothetical protein